MSHRGRENSPWPPSTVRPPQGSAGFILAFSLTQASSMRQVENLRQQIFRVKGLPTPALFPIDEFSEPDETGPSSTIRQGPIHTPGGGRRFAPRPKPSRPPLDPSGDEGSRTSGEDPNMVVDIHDRYQHIPASRHIDSIPLVIVGTKCDLVGDREVSREMAIRYLAFVLMLMRFCDSLMRTLCLYARMATLWGVPYYETSAKLNVNVDAVFLVSCFAQVAQCYIVLQPNVT